MFISFDDGKFEIKVDRAKQGTKVDAYDTEAIAKVIYATAVEENDPEGSGIMLSSSVDFPQESGAPEGFDGREAISAALALLND